MSTIEKNPIWHIAGIGAMGSVVASSFCHAQHPVHLLLKNEQQLSEYQHSKLTMISDNNAFSCQPRAINIEHIGNQPINYLFCCVKAYDVTNLLMRLQHNLDKNSLVILLHNGLGVLEEIKEKLPQLRIISGISTIGGYLEKPFTVRAFLNGTFYLGGVLGQFTSQEIQAICTVFQTSTLPFQWKDDIKPLIWEKFALNCSVNLLTALFACKNGELLNHVDALKKITREVSDVVQAYNISLSTADLYLKVTELLGCVANNYSSMYQDVQQNKPTELPYLNEHLITLALQKKIATPFNIDLVKQFYAKVSL